MTTLKSEFLLECQSRGFLHQATDLEGLDHRLTQKPLVAYLGFDATATSLHVGNLMQIMLLRILQKYGHKPLVLIGGGTTRAGDPSGKDEMRKLLSVDDIANNSASIGKIFKKYLKFGEGLSEAILVNNADWLLQLNYLDFLRDYGRHFSVNRMLTFDSIRMRLEREQNLSFLEFNYMVLQAYDFLELNRRYECVLQFGGADQWGNIVSGVDLVRRVDQKDVYGMTTPLITTSDGAKMGKTARGAIWLNEDMLSSYDYWQFWRNTADQDVGRFLRLYTEISLDEIKRLESLEGAEINEAKKVLADAATLLCHGAGAVQEARKTAESLFVKAGGEDYEAMLAALPSMNVSKDQVSQGLSVLDLFKNMGLTTSNGETRRLIQGSGARLNDQLVSDEFYKVTLDDFDEKGRLKLTAGKKRHGLVILQS